MRYVRNALRVGLCLLVLAGCAELVETPVRIMSFEAREVDDQPGLHRLTWVVSGLEGGSVILEPGINGHGSLDVTERTADGTGQIDVNPDTTTTYTLTATSGLDPSQSVSRSVEVDVEMPGAPGITAFGAEPPEANPGVDVTLSWTASDYDALVLQGPGLGGGVDVSGETSYTVVPTAGADYTLTATNGVATVDRTLQDVGRTVPASTFLIAGQSNAQGKNVELSDPSDADSIVAALDGVKMLGNDYAWKDAYEPLDDCTGQVDVVSRDPALPDPCTNMGNSGVSYAVSLGNRVHQATGGTVYLIPAAKGGSDTPQWLPQSNRYDRSSLFGSAAHRARLAGDAQAAPIGYEAGGDAYGAVTWYQGESDTNTLTEANNYASRTDQIFDAFQAELDAPIIFAQLGRIVERLYTPYSEDGRNLLMQQVRDAQLELENEGEGRYLVVTHDLPLADRIHLDAWAQVELGRRMALAFREHMLGADVDGSGPRPVDVVKEGDSIVRVDFDRPIRPPQTTGANAYSGYFAVFDGDTELSIAAIERGSGGGGSNNSVVITLQNPTGSIPDVRYMPREGEVTSDAQSEDVLDSFVADVVRSATCGEEPIPEEYFGVAGLCLPAPAFGTSSGGVALDAMQFLDIEAE